MTLRQRLGAIVLGSVFGCVLVTAVFIVVVLTV